MGLRAACKNQAENNAVMSVVLMYHSVFPDNDTSAIDAEDLPYALSLSDFTQQLDLLAERNVGLFANAGMPQVVISFDDGHVSNLQLAAPLLQERNLSAYFFITSEFIGQRAHFMSADELFELSQLPGMCIGSHGMTHRFFDDMSADESVGELTGSRVALEAICGSACRSISFPGGRFSPGTLQQLKMAGYHQWFGSEVGIIKQGAIQYESATSAQSHEAGKIALHAPAMAADTSVLDQPLADRWQLGLQHSLPPLERVAIRRNTQLHEFRRIIGQDSAWFRRKRFNSQVKHLARRVLGNRFYHGLYKSFSAR